MLRGIHSSISNKTCICCDGRGRSLVAQTIFYLSFNIYMRALVWTIMYPQSEFINTVSMNSSACIACQCLDDGRLFSLLLFRYFFLSLRTFPITHAVIHVIVTFVRSLPTCAPIAGRAPNQVSPASMSYTRPARPTCIISPVSLSSERRTGHAVLSALTSVSSSFVPSMRYLQSSGLTGP